jgi:hypothetical protein
MTQQGEQVKTPGKRMTTAGILIGVLGVVLGLMAMATTHSDYVPGVGNVETQGSPSAVSIIMVIAGIVLVGVGYVQKRRA